MFEPDRGVRGGGPSSDAQSDTRPSCSGISATGPELQADTLFMGIPAISFATGLMSDYMPETLTDRALAIAARSVVF